MAKPALSERVLRAAAIRTARILDRALPYGRRTDAIVLTVRFVGRHGRLPDRTGYSDILLRRLVSADNRGPLRRRVSDKIEVKAHVADRIGTEYVVPTAALWSCPSEVDVDALPADCCVKPTHMSGAFAFRRGGAALDRAAIDPWFAADYYHMSREENYAGLRRRVMAEPLIFGQESPWDYKFVCSAGRVRFIILNVQVRPVYRRCVLDREFRPLPFAFDDLPPPSPPAPPASLPLMIELAETLAADFDFIRVDLYTDGTEVRFGELTNVPSAGMHPVRGDGAEQALGRRVFGACLPGREASAGHAASPFAPILRNFCRRAATRSRRPASASSSSARARPIASIVVLRSRCAPPIGSGTIRSITPSVIRSCAVRRRAAAASRIFSESFHRIDAHPSGEITE